MRLREEWMGGRLGGENKVRLERNWRQERPKRDWKGEETKELLKESRAWKRGWKEERPRRGWGETGEEARGEVKRNRRKKRPRGDGKRGQRDAVGEAEESWKRGVGVVQVALKSLFWAWCWFGTCWSGSDVPLRIESYSCKMAGDDKHMFKQFCQEGQPHVLEALSPPQTTGISPSRYHRLGEAWLCPLHDGEQGGGGSGDSSKDLGWLLCFFLELLRLEEELLGSNH